MTTRDLYRDLIDVTEGTLKCKRETNIQGMDVY